MKNTKNDSPLEKEQTSYKKNRYHDSNGPSSKKSIDVQELKTMNITDLMKYAKSSIESLGMKGRTQKILILEM